MSYLSETSIARNIQLDHLQHGLTVRTGPDGFHHVDTGAMDGGGYGGGHG